ncbi:MAG TPA: tryptophan-rich sensory protein [Candidatus Egerieimonas intestinavium]|uniref:Tryptophan-rich sensory protein n=1 Tax=Candidatus Egerieimonas intestinavium TaxID=2840777 RepID=A0A9D1JG29_9FIRM|nr:tryptophan-rich sensory protein [Candidatus Egerieimonas intestinavium]
MKEKGKSLLVSIAVPLVLGGLSALLTKDSMQKYAQLPQPPLAPPPAVFPIVWSILFLLMGISSWLVWEAFRARKPTDPAVLPGLGTYVLQLAVNFLWPLFFFRAGWLGFSFLWLLLLLFLVILMVMQFASVSKLAALLQIPYLLWLIFAGYLNLSIFLMTL